jgi:hypothetical protein
MESHDHTSASIRPARTLAKLAGQINAEHTQALHSIRSSLTHARNAGLLLVEAKKRCGHGRWLPWLEANVRMSERTAQKYMRLSARWDELVAKAPGTADLTIEEGLKLLADPDDSEREREREREAARIGGATVEPEILLELDTPEHMEDFVAGVKSARVPREKHREAVEAARRRCAPGIAQEVWHWWYVQSGRQDRDQARAAREAADRNFRRRTRDGDFGSFLLMIGEKVRDLKRSLQTALKDHPARIYDNPGHCQKLTANIAELQAALAELVADLAVPQQPIRIVEKKKTIEVDFHPDDRPARPRRKISTLAWAEFAESRPACAQCLDAPAKEQPMANQRPKKSPPGFLTWLEAAAEYQVSPRKLKSLARAGHLKKYRQHGRRETLLAREELSRVLAPRVVPA